MGWGWDEKSFFSTLLSKRFPTDCYTCRQNALPPQELPPRERIYDDGAWRVAHAFGVALPGWLVAVTRRHVESLPELTAEEAAALGPLLVRLSAALEAETGARKCYVMFFAEGEGFAHLHVHVVPRLPDLPPDRRGPSVFWYMARPEAEWVSAAAMDALAERVRGRLDEG